MNALQYRVIVIGTSAGGLEALKIILPSLPAAFPVPIVVVQHISARSDGFMIKYFNNLSAVRVKEAEEKEPLKPATVYFAPPNYHLLIEDNQTLSLSVEPKVNWARPSIDVLFDSAAYAYGNGVIGVLLTGANQDGASGLARIQQAGGWVIVQTPETSYAEAMPRAALARLTPNQLLPLEEIGAALRELLIKKA